MRLYPKAIPYSSVVGGGLSFVDENGAVRFLAAVRGSSGDFIGKEENDNIVEQIIAKVGPGGLEVPDEDVPESLVNFYDELPGSINPKNGIPVHAVGDNVSTDMAKAKGYTGSACQTCYNFTMVRSGTCETCISCGATSGGCS